MFKVGQKVVCVSCNFYSLGELGEVLPEKGEIYTVRSTEIFKGRQCITLEEIMNQPRKYLQGMVECVFGADNFRPVDHEFGRAVCESLEVMTEPELV